MSVLLQNVLVGLLVGAAALALLRRWLPWRIIRRALQRVLARASSPRLQAWGQDPQKPPAVTAAMGCGSGCPSCGGCSWKRREPDAAIPPGRQSDARHRAG